MTFGRKGAGVVTEMRSGGRLVFAVQGPERSHDCYRLICPGDEYLLTIEEEIVCPDCVRAEDASRWLVA